MSTRVRQVMKTTGMILMLASVTAPASALAQREFERAGNDAQQQSVDKIREIQSRDGPNAADLIEPWTTLGLLYQAEGDHELAAAVFTQVGGIVRVNYGLNSIEEAVLLRHLVAAYEALGDSEEAWKLEQELIALASQHLSDMRVAPIFREIAAKRFDMLEQYRRGEFPAQLVLGCYYKGGPSRRVNRAWRERGNQSCTSGSSRRLRGAIAADAISHLRKAAQPYVRNKLYTSTELREIEEEIFRRGGGAGALIRLLDYEVLSASSTLTQVNALIRTADYLLGRSFGRGRSKDASIFALYEDAHRALVQRGIDQASIDAIFSPRIPIVPSTPGPNPLISEKTPESTGHIDIAFDITKYGRSESVDVLDTTTNATRAARRDLIRLIERSRFRPRVTGGEFADSTRVVIRYYLNN